MSLKTTVTGRVIKVDENREFKSGGMIRENYYHVTILTEEGGEILVYLSHNTLTKKMFAYDDRNDREVRTGIITPRLNMVFQLEGRLVNGYMNYVSKILRLT